MLPNITKSTVIEYVIQEARGMIKVINRKMAIDISVKNLFVDAATVLYLVSSKGI